LKHLARLARDRSARVESGFFVLEGVKLVSEALADGVDLDAVYVEDGDGDGLVILIESAIAIGITVHRVAPGALKGVLGTVTPQPVVAATRIPGATLEGLSGADLLLVLVEVADPGNVGALLRTAHAAGAGGVICTERTADPFAPKCVRASAGAVLRLPIVTGVDPAEAMGWSGRAGFRRLATVPSGGDRYDRADLRDPIAIVLGSEAHGLPSGLTDPAAELVDQSLTIPMVEGSGSLNVAAVGAVICFEARRQRSAEPSPRPDAGPPLPQPVTA